MKLKNGYQMFLEMIPYINRIKKKSGCRRNNVAITDFKNVNATRIKYPKIDFKC